MTRNLLRIALGLAAPILAAAAALPAHAEKPVLFLCNAPAGHVCQFRINTAAGPIDFALPSGQKKEVAGVTPHADKYCVCDPGPVTPDCTAPQTGKWCLGQWLAVDPGQNSLNDVPNDRFATLRAAN